MNEPDVIRDILENVRTIAVVGLTNREGRASYGVSRFMQSQGYRVIPVNPRIDNALGEKAYPDLDAAYAALDGKIDLVNVFRRPEHVPEGVVHDEAAEWAEKAGIRVVMDRCILKDRMAAGWRSRA
jgi:predicted CoA-binding protein